MFFEFHIWYQNVGIASLAAKCEKTHEFFKILEENVNETLVFIEWMNFRDSFAYRGSMAEAGPLK